MSDNHAVDIDKHVRAYLFVFASLMVLTLVTVAVAEFHFLPVPVAIGLALVIAVVKGSLVACYFMHLISERKLIYWVLALTVAFFAALLLIPTFTALDIVRY